MIDIHSHILWGLDDGPAQSAQSIAMARAAVAEGIHTVIATPHHANGRYVNHAKDVEKAVRVLNDILLEEDIPLTVLSGQEIRMYEQLLDDLDHAFCQPLCDTRYILIELPAHEVPEGINELIYELQLMHLVPIIAHPERNKEIASDVELLVKLVTEGALCQVTASSINGRFGRTVQKVALSLCRRQCVHFVASDAHNVTTRGFGLREAYDVIERYCGVREVTLYKENAEKLIANQEIHRPEPLRAEKRWFMKFIKNRGVK